MSSNHLSPSPYAVHKGNPGMAYQPEQFRVSPALRGPFQWGQTVHVKSAYEQEREGMEQYRRKQEEASAAWRETDAQRRKNDEIARIQLDMDRRLQKAEQAVKEGEERSLLDARRKKYGYGTMTHRQEWQAKRDEAERAKKLAKEAEADAVKLKAAMADAVKLKAAAPPPAPKKKEEKLSIARPIVKKKSGYEGAPAPRRTSLSLKPSSGVTTRSSSSLSKASAYQRSGRHVGGAAAGAAALASDLAGKLISRSKAERAVKNTTRRR
jgi:hypothetical protein